MAVWDFSRSGGTATITKDGVENSYANAAAEVIQRADDACVFIEISNDFYDVSLSDTITLNGTPFSGTAEELRDLLAGSVFTEGIAAVATYADLAAATASGLFKVTTDETNGGEQTFYLKDGNTIHWLVTQGV
jgi:hypothetical protein